MYKTKKCCMYEAPFVSNATHKLINKISVLLPSVNFDWSPEFNAFYDFLFFPYIIDVLFFRLLC